MRVLPLVTKNYILDIEDKMSMLEIPNVCENFLLINEQNRYITAILPCGLIMAFLDEMVSLWKHKSEGIIKAHRTHHIHHINTKGYYRINYYRYSTHNNKIRCDSCTVRDVYIPSSKQRELIL